MFILLLCTAIFLTDAMEVRKEDNNSALVSHLLAKLQRLESQMMIRSNSRNIVRRAATKAPLADKKQCNCSPGQVNYFRWGNSTCPIGADTIYSGVVAGSHYSHSGAAVDPLCLPPDPQYLLYQSGYQDHVYLYGAEYITDNNSPINNANNRNVPCALCNAYGRTSKVMIPSRIQCPPGWRREYYGYLMAGYHGNNAATQFTCIDKTLELIPGSGADTGGYLFYTVETQCSQHIPCSAKEMTCVVCTK